MSLPKDPPMKSEQASELTRDVLDLLRALKQCRNELKADAARMSGNIQPYAKEYLEGIVHAADAALDHFTPRCPQCGYTKDDCQFHLDHRHCGQPEPDEFAYPLSTVAPQESGAVAWMIELQGQTMPLWYSGQERPGVPVSTICAFTPDPLGGIRYPTKEAAGYALTRLRWSGGRSLENAILAVTEHEWGTFTHPAPPAPWRERLEALAAKWRERAPNAGSQEQRGIYERCAHELESLAAQQGDGNGT